MNRKGTNENSKKILLITIGIVVLMVAVVVGIFMSKGKAKESNEDTYIELAIEERVEYGEDLLDKTFPIHMENETKEANFADLAPEVDTMKVW